MIYLKLLTVLLVFFVLKSRSSSSDWVYLSHEWSNYLNKYGYKKNKRAELREQIKKIFESEQGKEYSEGFPRGFLDSIMWAENAVPFMSNLDDYTYWPYYIYTKLHGALGDVPAYTYGLDMPKEYTEYIRKITERLCDAANNYCCGSGGRCIKELFSRKRVYITTVVKSPEKDLPLIFIYSWCMKHYEALYIKIHKLSQRDKMILDRHCPKTCLNDPCAMVSHAIPNQCEVFGPHKGDYNCICESGYKWDRANKKCHRQNPCFHESPNNCVAENTVVCIPKDDFESDPICICENGFKGPRCEETIDPCQEKLSSVNLTGKQACNSTLGNTCVPNGLKYSCQCIHPYMTQLLPYDNCHGVQSGYTGESKGLNHDDETNREDKIVYLNKDKTTNYNGQDIDCMNGGFPVKYPNGSLFCVCPIYDDGIALFTGRYCEVSVSKWSNWVDVGTCYPKTCGTQRYRSRRRACLVVNDALKELRPCLGASEEIIPCEAIPCQAYYWLNPLDFTDSISGLEISILAYIIVLELFCIIIFSILLTKYPDIKISLSEYLSKFFVLCTPMARWYGAKTNSALSSTYSASESEESEQESGS